ncbi:MAG: hypothetical protein D3910_20065 [Candidatus Electrothrix sp. ATG2]|nr:hypothetical protein [Candidatus Electrothrix sp. ATG2]
MLISAGLDLGIPLDRLRRLELILGTRLNFISDRYQDSLLLGFRVGLMGKFGSTGLRLGGFAEGGGFGVTDFSKSHFGKRPYVEGGVNFGYSLGGNVNFALEAAGGKRESNIPPSTFGAEVNSEFLPYYRLGVMLGGSF